jgi:hypothetical protein
VRGPYPEELGISTHEDYEAMGMRDKGGRRLGEDRRKLSILGYLPDRRFGQDRRANEDRRTRMEMEKVAFLKRNADRYMEFANTQKGLLYGLLLSLPLWGLIIFMFFIRHTPKF